MISVACHIIANRIVALLGKEVARKHFGTRLDDGRPPARHGSWFLALVPGTSTPGPTCDVQNHGLDELFSFDLVLTYRTARLANQQLHTAYLNLELPDIGMEARLRKIWTHLHQNRLAIMAEMNTFLTTAGYIGGGGFVEAYHYQGTRGPLAVGPDWFHSDADDPAAIGHVLTASFTNLRRMQSALTANLQ